MRTLQAAAPRPWWKEPWPWILLGLPGTVVVASLVTIAIAAIHADSLVTEHYYKKGLAVGHDIDKELRAKAMHLQGRLDQRGQDVVLEVEPDVADTGLLLRLRHPYAPEHDLRLELRRTAPGRYLGHAPTEAVRYAVTAESPQWRLSGVWKPGAASPLRPGV
ncbi:FixH family protein [Thiomonas delicata]|uniref:FixH family protein n=1 Tax=Thiomonas delicata TaxID=364030 RepID=A0A238D9D5_THIDL|nr:FixH family protein [Thiomonas delicata]SBP89831.1 FixH family protein [Thiomonas delicata]